MRVLHKCRTPHTRVTTRRSAKSICSLRQRDTPVSARPRLPGSHNILDDRVSWLLRRLHCAIRPSLTASFCARDAVHVPEGTFQSRYAVSCDLIEAAALHSAPLGLHCGRVLGGPPVLHVICRWRSCACHTTSLCRHTVPLAAPYKRLHCKLLCQMRRR